MDQAELEVIMRNFRNRFGSLFEATNGAILFICEVGEAFKIKDEDVILQATIICSISKAMLKEIQKSRLPLTEWLKPRDILQIIKDEEDFWKGHLKNNKPRIRLLDETLKETMENKND